MAPRVLLSFHYERAIWRDEVVRNGRQEPEAARFFDAPLCC